MRKDAMVMELLSATPRAIDLYAHCAMSSVVEFAGTDMDEALLPTLGFPPRGVRGGDESFEARPYNDDLSPPEKLEVALEMAKCLAVMHGHPGTCAGRVLGGLYATLKHTVGFYFSKQYFICRRWANRK